MLKQPGDAGLVSPTAKSVGAVVPLDHGAFGLSGGFWGRWCELNRQVTIPLALERFEEAGNFYDFRLAAGDVRGAYRGPVYQDSDVYKWLEAVAWERGRKDSAELYGMHQQVTSLVAAAQCDDGYLNSYWGRFAKTERFSDLAQGHELYCAGHLIQAAIAQSRALGEAALLGVAQRFADYLVTVFGPNLKQGVGGHPEIEMALVELYRTTDDVRYLDLASYFVGARGGGLVVDDQFGPAYYQDRVPLRETRSIEGHAVRALYLAAGATDVAVETGDRALLGVLESLWADMVATKTYLTGGLGSRWEGEAFGEAFELPNDRAYCESCAAIGSVQWSWRLLLATGSATYADLIERTLFNATIVGLSLDGTRFFYVNPLELKAGDDHMSSRSAGRGRQLWYGTACCPTNIMRLLASLDQYFWTQSSRGLQLQQYASGRVKVERPEGLLDLMVTTDYPWSGVVEIDVIASARVPWELSLRVPQWCGQLGFEVNAQAQRTTSKGGYLSLEREWRSGDKVRLEMSMPVRQTRALRAVDSTYGAVALERGPIVYCFEQQDVANNGNLADMRLLGKEATTALRLDLLAGAQTVSAPVAFASPPEARFPYTEEVTADIYDGETSAIAVPYFAWANREVGPMRVWVPEVVHS